MNQSQLNLCRKFQATSGYIATLSPKQTKRNKSLCIAGEGDVIPDAQENERRIT